MSSVDLRHHISSVDLRHHIDCTQGKVFLNNEECMDATALTATFTPITSSTKTLGHTGENTQWKGFTVACTLTEYRSRDWLKQAINNFMQKGVTPEFTIQAVSTDEQSDYFQEYGGQTLTMTGCVPTGDIPLIAFDASADFMTDSITFSVKDFKWS